MPVLPLVGSRMVAPGVSSPAFSAASIIAIAARSLMEPVGLWSSSLAQSRTSEVGGRDGSPTGGGAARGGVLELGPEPRGGGRRQGRQPDERRAAEGVDEGGEAGHAELFRGRGGRRRQPPPATAGGMVTEAPALTGVPSAPVNRTSSSLT